MRYLALILQLPHCVEEVPNGERFYVWPSVHCAGRTDADWDTLVDVYPYNDLREMREADSYYGFRAGITETGDWQYFVAGD